MLLHEVAIYRSTKRGHGVGIATMPRVVPSQIVAMIDQQFPHIGQPSLPVGHLTVGTLNAIVRMIDEIPAELLTISGADYANLVCGAEAINNSIAFWRQAGHGQISQPGVSGKNALALIREALVKCPDQMPAPSTTELAFVTDDELRDSIRLDISEAFDALHRSDFKSATVLAGSAIEALLLWALQNGGHSAAPSGMKNRPKGPPENWDLPQYIEAATILCLIDKETGDQASRAKDFRNLIHPGRAQRLAMSCDRGTALAALAGVELVARDLTP